MCKGYSDMVEIGTWRGVSALVFASWGIKVHTFDIIEQEHCKPLWELFEVEVDQHICIDRKDISGWMDIVPFDFAFIDAVHDYDNVKADFEMVKRCGRVIFHDYDEVGFPGVYKFVNEIGGVPGPYSAYWWKDDS
jgi:predicted O-methyltransferase YrrM